MICAMTVLFYRERMHHKALVEKNRLMQTCFDFFHTGQVSKLQA